MTIESEAFAVTKIEKIDMSKCKIGVLSERLFYNCENLREVILPESLTSISSYCFEKCKQLEYIDMPRYLRYIGYAAFDRCEKLKKVDLSNSEIECIRFGAFQRCNNIEVILPKCYEASPMEGHDFLGMKRIRFK